jgi:hypothetical protein
MENIQKPNQTHPFNVGEQSANNWENNLQTIGENPLKGGFHVGSHFMFWKLYFQNKTQND